MKDINLPSPIKKLFIIHHSPAPRLGLRSHFGEGGSLGAVGSFIIGHQGQSLIEIIIAMAVAVVIVISLVGLTIVSLRNSQFARSQTAATKLTQEAMEKIRLWRDTSWTDFSSKVGNTYLLGNNCQLSPSFSCATILSACPITGNETSLINDQFLRCATLAAAGTDRINVTVATVWRDSKGVHQSSASSIFSNPSAWAK